MLRLLCFKGLFLIPSSAGSARKDQMIGADRQTDFGSFGGSSVFGTDNGF